MSRYALGLVVGKFAPLHRGHEWLVAHAAARCDRLLILSYARPEFAGCGVEARRAWLAARFPGQECLVVDDAWLREACAAHGVEPCAMPANDEADAVQQQFLAWLLRDALRRAPDAMFCSEAYGPPCAAVLTRELGRRVDAVVVDQPRAAVPISATRLRTLLHGDRAAFAAARPWLAPEVRASFVRRVVLLGGESSGKTTLAAALAARLGTCWVAEYGRELWEARAGRLDEDDLHAIGREQLRREDAAAGEAQGVLVCDTSPLTTAGYFLWMFGRSDPELEQLAGRRYDAVVLCAPDFPFVQDGTRREAAFRLRQHAWYLERLGAMDVPVFVAAGAPGERLDAVAAWLDAQLAASTPDRPVAG